MLLDEYREDGLLIEAEGFDYPRYSMFVPDAKSIFDKYKATEPELKLHDMIKNTVEKIVELAHTDEPDSTSLTATEHSAVNRVVARSSRAGGAKNEERYSTEIAFLMEVRLSFG